MDINHNNQPNPNNQKNYACDNNSKDNIEEFEIKNSNEKPLMFSEQFEISASKNHKSLNNNNINNHMMFVLPQNI